MLRHKLTVTGAIITVLMLFATVSAMPPHPDIAEHYQQRESESAAAPVMKEHKPDPSTGLNTPSKVFGASKAAISGSRKALVVPIQFPDQAGVTAASAYDNLVFGSSLGNVAHYYSTMSAGNLTIDQVDAAASIGWQTAPQNLTYYANGGGGTGSYPNNTQKLCEDVVGLIDASIDFSQYDGNSDGIVDLLVLVHSGTGGEWSGDGNDIWSHKWGISPALLRDGVYIYEYCIVPEYWVSSGDITCGVYCHEMGHILGLPDLYDTDNSSWGIGDWSLMASGSWNGPSGKGGSPAGLDAWCRLQLGFNTYSNVTSNATGVSIAAVYSGGPIYRLWSSGAIGNEYYLVENRLQTGYDTYLPGEGLLIWHIDDGESNNTGEWYPGYTSNGHYMVALEQADGNFYLEKKVSQGTSGHPYPGSTSNTSFAPGDTPSSNDYNGANTYVSVTNISAAGATMTADFTVSLLSDVDNEPDEILPGGFVLGQNAPNPFNPITEISFELNRASQVKLSIYNTLGQLVSTLADEYYTAGIHHIVWDGRDDYGSPASSGVYMYELVTDFGDEAKKMLLVK